MRYTITALVTRSPGGTAAVRSFASGELVPGKVFRNTFTVAVINRRFCIPQKSMGMIGAIRVEPAA